VSAPAATAGGRELPAPRSLPRLLAGVRADGRAVGLHEHLDLHGGLPPVPRRRASEELIRLVEASGLLGRGGAAFPTGRKLRAVATSGRRPFVLVNGAEGEPLSGKDAVLLAYVPHLVLDGAAVAAAAVGAREAAVAVAARGALAAVQAAIAEREQARVDRVRMLPVGVPDRFVAGEETAVVNLLNGGPAVPTSTPPRPFERGVRGAPTLVLNAETAAHLALLARHGSTWFRSVGTPDEPGSALVTLGGAVARPGVYEIPLGLPLHDLVEWAGGPSRRIAAFVVGGYFGGWIAADDAGSVRLADAELRLQGASLGARAIFALPAGACGVVETARVARYLAGESAGQCGPCVHGLDAIAGALEQLAARRCAGRSPVAQLERWLGLVQGRGACRHPDGTARFVASGLRVFADEVARHVRGSCSGSEAPVLPLVRPQWGGA
jgi:NADH:ubiquinone oxidoreductase subunit F (NADH-binding)